MITDRYVGGKMIIAGTTELIASWCGNKITISLLSGLPEITTIQSRSAVNITPSSYFVIQGPRKYYYVWYQVDNIGTDPKIRNCDSILISIKSAWSAIETAAELYRKLNMNPEFIVNHTITSDTITITTAEDCNINAPIDNGTGFVFTIIQDGINPILYSGILPNSNNLNIIDILDIDIFADGSAKVLVKYVVEYIHNQRVVPSKGLKVSAQYYDNIKQVIIPAGWVTLS